MKESQIVKLEHHSFRSCFFGGPSGGAIEGKGKARPPVAPRAFPFLSLAFSLPFFVLENKGRERQGKETLDGYPPVLVSGFYSLGRLLMVLVLGVAWRLHER